MTEQSAIPMGYGLDELALQRVIDRARARTDETVSSDEVVDVFGNLDPTPELVEIVRASLLTRGLILDDSEPDLVGLDVEVDDEADAGTDPDVEEIMIVAHDPLLADLDDDDLVERRLRARFRPSTRETMKMNAPTAGSSDSTRMYLREIGRVALLTGPEEVVLAKQIERGTAASERLADLAASGELESLDVAERRLLTRFARKGEDAKAELTQANLRLVVSIAKRYAGRGMQLLDLVQEGNFGLMRAVEKFDWTKGFKFSTYATWWIRQSISRSIADQARTIRIPVHMVEAINRMHRIQREMAQQLEREPTVEELAERVDLPPERVREMLRISQDPLSLDQPWGDESDAAYGDFIEDKGAEAPADVAARTMLHAAVEEALSELNEREQALVRMRFGLDDGQPRTLEDVGKEFGVTRERVRQIETKTLAKLRHEQFSQKLHAYLEGE